MSVLPRLAIVIPVYAHPMLVAESLQSALSQEAEFGIRIIVINDGCLYAETDLVLTSFALAYPEKITCLRKPNGGLSSARNAGITHVLEHMPSVEAIFMLDADNRLRPTSMAKAMAQLDAHPEAGWVYPSIDMFGIPARCDYGGSYSRLIHSEMNVSEAGSLIRREVFEAGVMFDEDFKQGFEDWHFFLSAGDKGFVGVNLEDFGFFYRKRPESMLANADRQRDRLVEQLHAAHPDLYRPATQLRLEHDEAPRYALWCSDHDEVRLVTDPNQPGQIISQVEYVRMWWHSRTAPTQVRVPPFLLVTSEAFLTGLSEAGVVHWVLWRLESMIGADEMVCARLAAPRRAGQISSHPCAPQPETADLWVLGVEAVATILKGSAPLLSDISGESSPPCFGLALRLDMPEPAKMNPPLATEALRGALARLYESSYRAAGQRRWCWRQPSIAQRGKEHLILRKAFRGVPPLPRRPEAGCELGVVVTSTATLGLADVLKGVQANRAQGSLVTLFVMAESTSANFAGFREQIDRVVLLSENGFAGRDVTRRHFNGVALPGPTGVALDDRALALMAGLDTVYVVSCPEASRLMGAMRRQGGTTVLCMLDRNAKDASTLALAYEHAYDWIVVPDMRSVALLHAQGVPSAKLKSMSTCFF